MRDARPWGIHWFRRDLRVAGNPALAWNCKKHDGRVLGVFCFDHAFLARPDFSQARFAFFLKTLDELRETLRTQGGELLTLDVGPEQSFKHLLESLRRERAPLPAAWSWNRDYEPFAVARDARVRELLELGFGIATHVERDHLLIEPHELYKGAERGSFYQVFTPFSKKWLSLLEQPEIASRLRAPRIQGFDLRWKDRLKRPPEDVLSRYLKDALARTTIPLPQAGERAARERLSRFKKTALRHYARDRDFPAIDGTSHLSIDLKNGAITSAQVIASLGPRAAGKFLTELIWREFYYHLLAHVPRVETTAFQLKYETLPWSNHPERLSAWKAGLTGFPIVDAGMRQLKQTGWMHNRVRMIVASFLTKDLHCDWKLGERHFMQHLLDGDLAPNNGGWQWAASTGCDPQPYFRIFNPTLQGRRFDPNGEYVRRWVPELVTGAPYPRPIVDHASQAKKAVEMFKPSPEAGSSGKFEANGHLR